MAPELMAYDQKQHTSSPAAIDVYSFGITMYAVLAQQHPYRDGIFRNMSMWTLRDKIEEGSRPSVDADLATLPYGVIALMTACWNQDPDSRPHSFREICRELNECIEQVKSNAKPWGQGQADAVTHTSNPMFLKSSSTKGLLPKKLNQQHPMQHGHETSGSFRAGKVLSKQGSLRFTEGVQNDKKQNFETPQRALAAVPGQEEPETKRETL
jgi:hypothetical protein